MIIISLGFLTYCKWTEERRRLFSLEYLGKCHLNWTAYHFLTFLLSNFILHFISLLVYFLSRCWDQFSEYNLPLFFKKNYLFLGAIQIKEYVTLFYSFLTPPSCDILLLKITVSFKPNDFLLPKHENQSFRKQKNSCVSLLIPRPPFPSFDCPLVLS